jgi:hypothetical protein
MTTYEEQKYTQASIATADNLKSIAYTLMAQDLSRLSLPEVDEAVSIVSKMVPAGNVPGVILNGMARITGRRMPQQTVKRDVNLLFKGVEQVMDHAAYGAFFAGPAAVIWGYQNLLRLAGKRPEDSFPQGTWQFYVDYALREDTARHTNETHGFDTLLNQHGITVNPVDRMTAWVMTAIQILHQYPALLENEWRERTYTHLANDLSGGKLATAYGIWERQRPYGRRADSGNLTYPAYRRAKFDAYMDEILTSLSPEQQEQWRRAIAELESERLPDYVHQMSIWSYLEPEAHSENHIDLPLEELVVGLIYGGRYYLIPVVRPDSQPNDIMTVRGQVAAILQNRLPSHEAQLARLAVVKRTSLPGLMPHFNDSTRDALRALGHAPILINADVRLRDLPLAYIRQAERGIGDHALTIFDAGSTFVFDQSHIYFDGAWGAALAEIMTNESLSWAQYLATLPAPRADAAEAYPLNIQWTSRADDVVNRAPTIAVESSAESHQINIRAIVGLRKLFKQRSDLLKLTVNDLLVLYRAIHAVTYQPAQKLVSEIEALARSGPTRDAARAALDALRDQSNPAILIPVDASLSSPFERLYPMSFDVPLGDLDLLRLHDQTLDALLAYKSGSGDRSAAYEEFDRLQREYLATLAGFGAVLSRAKEIALSGEGASSGTIRLLAHMPRPLQRLLDQIPSKIDLLNDIIKGREVFSNVGAVASTSTLTRFITAKDDNEKKTLAWGVITDAEGVMTITLRDFRPHVRLLVESGQAELAQTMTQHYLDAYVQDLNDYIADLRRITLASRETRMTKGLNDVE